MNTKRFLLPVLAGLLLLPILSLQGDEPLPTVTFDWVDFALEDGESKDIAVNAGNEATYLVKAKGGDDIKVEVTDSEGNTVSSVTLEANEGASITLQPTQNLKVTDAVPNNARGATGKSRRK